MDPELEDLYQDIIVDHDRSPRNYGAMPDATHRAEGYNPLCGDHHQVFAHVASGRVVRASFFGRGCAISRASASIMTTLVTGLTVAEVEALTRAVESFLISGDDVDIGDESDLVALRGVYRYPTRRACALLAWSALERAIEGAADEVSGQDVN